MDMSLSKLWETVKDRDAWHASVYGVTKSQTWLRTEQQQINNGLKEASKEIKIATQEDGFLEETISCPDK